MMNGSNWSTSARAPPIWAAGRWMTSPAAAVSPYFFPSGTLLAPGEFLVRYRLTTKVALNQDADTVTLLAPGGRVADTFAYTNPRPDASYSRSIDGAGDWTDAYPPSPGQPNRPGEPAPTRTPTPTRTPAATRTPTPTRTVTLTPTAVLYDRSAIRLNEVLPAPAEIDWNGDGSANMDDEWVELTNRGQERIDLGGWALDDLAGGGSAAYRIPPGTFLQPGGFLLLFRGQTGVALNNDADTARLLGPDGAEVDAFAYAKPRSDASYSRSTDGGGDWTDAYPPSPGRPNVPAAPTPTATATATPTPFAAGVALNEILPDPQVVDWDGNGTADWSDEWIELYNTGSTAATLGGWTLADDTKTYTIPAGTVIWPASPLLLFRRQTGLSLGDWRDRVTLSRPDGQPADQFAYDSGPGADRSFCRSVDGTGAWTARVLRDPRPGQPPPAPAVRRR